jgi:subtilisin family serine protease
MKNKFHRRRAHRIIGPLTIALFVLTSASSLNAVPVIDDADFVHDEVIVQFNTTASNQHLADALNRGALRIKKHLPAAGKQRGDSGLVLLKTKLPVAQALAVLQNHPAVQYAEPNTIKQHQSTSNDPNYLNGKLWGMYGDATTPANQYGSQAAEAWAAGNVGPLDGSIYVAVLDEGIDINHPDLAPNIGRNPGETGLDAFGRDKATNGIDDDDNGYVDDVYGYDFINNDKTVFDGGKDKDDHGTHVAGTIGAVGGNGLGVAGVCWNVKLLSGKFLGFKGGSVADEIEAIEYFIDLKQRHGLNIVAFNASYGGGQNLAEQIALIHAANAGILIVAAAGNYGNGTVTYPARYNTTLDALNSDGTVAQPGASYDAMISVAAFDSKGALPTWSGSSATTVELGAPGVGILSTLPGGRYGSMDGTSMATPHVTGACVLYLNSHQTALPWAIKSAILSSTIPTASLAGKTVTGGRLNVGGF